MSRVKRKKQNLRTTAVVFMMVVLIIIGFMFAGNQMRQSRQQTVQYTYPLPPSSQPPTETQGGGILESLSNLFKPIAESLGLSTTPPPGSESVGLDAVFGITSSTGQSLIFTQNVMSGVFVGQIGFAGVYVKPSLGSSRPLKLYDENYPQYEGEIWVKPVVNVRVFNGTVKAHSFTVKVKVAVDGVVVDEKTLVKEGSGPPPMRIEMDKASIKGRDLHQILKAPKGVGKGILKEAVLLAKPVVEGRRVCFYADYEGLVIFEDPVTGEDYPVYRKLENANMGCFDFAIAETGDFEMKISRNQTSAPVAEVMVAGYQEVEKLITVTKTLVYTYTSTVTYGGTATVTTTVTTTYFYAASSGSGKEKSSGSSGSSGGSSGGGGSGGSTTTIMHVDTTPSGGGGGGSGGGGGGSALYNSTVIVVENGRERIKTLAEVEAGDYVLTDRGFRKVTNVKEVWVDNIYIVFIEGGYVLRADSFQPILTAGGVRKVGELVNGDLIYTLDGWRKIEKIEKTFYDKPTIKVIDLSFDSLAFYYADGVLVEDVYYKVSGVVVLYPYSEFIFIGRG